MEENIKNRVILILGILTAICLVMTVASCNNVRRYRTARNKEMATRLDLEEKMSKNIQERQGVEGQLKSLSTELAQEKTTHEATNKALLQEQLVNQSLKEELEKITKLKQALEEDLKEALVKVEAAKSATAQSTTK